MSVKIPFARVRAFFIRYETEPMYKTTRLGQAFFIEFKDELLNVTDPNLFYASNYFEARDIIYLTYTEFDK